MPARRFIVLALMVLCLGCTPQERAPGLEASRGVGFGAGPGVVPDTPVETTPSTSGVSRPSEAATVIAVLGLVALVALADEFAACSGSGCGAAGGGAIAVAR